MLSQVWQKLDVWARKGTPFVLACGLVLLGVVPWPVPGLTSLAPMFALIAVHYWAVHQPEAMPAVAAFALGLTHDILGGTPLGLHALILVLVQGLVVSQRKHLARRPFIVDWWGFAVVAIAATGGIWIVGSLYFAQPLRIGPLVLQYLLTVFSYPLFAWLFSRLRPRLFRIRSDATGI